MAGAAARMTEQERRNVWLSVYGASVAGMMQGTDEIDDKALDAIADMAQEMADRGLEDYEATFVSPPPEDDEDEEDEEDEDDKPRRRGRRK